MIRLARAVRPEAVFLLLAVSCSQIFGIEDAHYDSSLAGGTAGTGAQTESGGGGSKGGTAGETGGSATGGSGNGSGAGDNGGKSTGGSSGQTSGRGGSASAGSDGGAGAGGDDGQPPGELCDRYCDAVVANCTGQYEQYRSREQCMGVCERLPQGSPGDQNVDTVECRLRQVQFAEAEPFGYCKSSGPLGAGKCGSNCDSYCVLMMATCNAENTGSTQPPAYFEDEQSCRAACNAIAPAPDGPTEYTSSASVEHVVFVGNHVYCRTYHINSAIAEDAPDEHCPHAMGIDTCVDQ